MSAPAEDAVALEDRVDLFLSIDGHGDGAAHPNIAEGRLVLGQRQAEGRQHALEALHDGGAVRLADRLRLGQAGHPQDVALPRAEGGQTCRGIRRGEDDVLVEVLAALVEVVRVPRQHHPHLAAVLLEDVGPGADQALLEVAVLLQDLAGEDHRDGLGEVLREQHVGRVEVHPQRVLVGCLHPLDLSKVERLHPLLRVGLEAVLDVRRHQLAAVQRRDVLPFDALAQLERPSPIVGARLPRLREIAPQTQVVGAARLVGEDVADEAVAGQAGELEEPDRLRQPRVEHRRVPGRGPRHDPAALRRLGAHRDPVGIRGRGLGRRSPCSPGSCEEDSRTYASPTGVLEEFAAVYLARSSFPVGVVAGHCRSPSFRGDGQ